MSGKVLRFARWPEADRHAWEAAVAEGDIFDGRGPAAHLSAGSRRSILAGYGRWIGWLTAEEPGALGLEPGERVERDRLRRYLDALNVEITPAGRFNYLKHLYDAIRYMAPDSDWSWLKAIVWRSGKGVRPKSKGERLVTPERLIQLGHELMELYDRQRPDTSGRRAYRDGLLIAFLAQRVIRRRNLAQMRIGRHLLRTGERWHVVFEASETKNHQPLEMTFPSDLVPALERYLQVVRPGFPGAAGHDGLWASTKGCPMSGDALYKTVFERTRAAFGQGINLHYFRHIAATEIARRTPREIGIARDLLGQRDLRALDRHYIQARQAEAGETYQSLLLAVRAESDQDRWRRKRKG